MKRIYATGKYSGTLDIAVDVEDGTTVRETVNAIDAAIQAAVIANIRQNVHTNDMQLRVVDHANLPTIGGQVL